MAVGSGVGLDAAFDGDTVDDDDGAGEDDGDEAGEGDGTPLAAAGEGGVDSGVVIDGAGAPGISEGEPIAATPPGLPEEEDAPCVDGVVVRAITSTRKARTISATRKAWPPVRLEATVRDPVRPRDGSSARGVARTAGQRSEPAGCPGGASDAEPDHSPLAAM